MITLAKPVLIALAVLLAISMLANAGLTWAYLGARDHLVEATGARDQARAAANSCSRGVKELEDQARERHQEAERNRSKAATLAMEHQGRAQQILAAPPAVPGDDCRSAAAAIDEWLAGRGTP